MLNLGQVKGELSEHILQKIGWQMVNLMAETRNAFENWYLLYASEHPEEINKMIELMRLAPNRIKCTSQIPKKSGPILICNSGRSLMEVLPDIKDWHHSVMCSTTQAATLCYHGRIPDYLTCLDPRTAPADEFASPDWGQAELLAHVSIPPEYVARWLKRAKGNIYMCRIMEPSYDWYSHHLGQGYPWIRHVMLPMIDSSAGNINIATWLGYNPIYLAGTDYRGPRFDEWHWNYADERWDFTKGSANAKAMGYASRGILLSSFMQIANGKYNQRIYNMSADTSITQFPHVRWKDVLENQEEDRPFDKAKVLDEIEITLALWDTFLVAVPGGWGMDYHTYIVPNESAYMSVLGRANDEIVKNKDVFKRIEEHHKKPVREMIANGEIQFEMGELLTHSPEEFGDWDWRRMEPIDIPSMLIKRRYLLEKVKERALTRDVEPAMERLKAANVEDIVIGK